MPAKLFRWTFMVSGWQNNENGWFLVFGNKSEWGSSVAKYSKPASDNVRKAKLVGDNRAIMTHCRWLIWHVSHRPYPFIISFFCFSVQSFLFLQKCPWLLPMIHYLWLIQRFPAMISPQVPDCCLYTLVRTNQSESWLNEIGTIQSKPIIQRV